MLAASLVVILAGVAVAWVLLHQRPPQAPPEPKQTRLTFNSSENAVQGVAISPDGKYLAYSDPAGIHVKLISSGEERVIPKPPGVSPAADWVNQYWFPDSTKLIANAWDPGGRGSIWTVSLLGQSAREIREDATGGAVSPDGMRVAYWGPIASEELPREIWVMGSEGDNPQKVIVLGENEGFGQGMWSPNGQRLAYIRMGKISQYGPQAVAIETCDLKGANRTVVVSDPGLEDFWWLPDQRIVYSRQESPDSNDDNLWQIGIDGRASTPIGKPKRITQWAGSRLFGLSASADGTRLTLQKQTYQEQVYLGELTQGGMHMNAPRRLTNDEASDEPSEWTADSKAVMFTSDRNGTSSIFKQGIDQDSVEPVVTGPHDVGLPLLSPDGTWILYSEFPKTISSTTPTLLMRIPANGGAPQLVLEERNSLRPWCARAPAIRCVLVEATEDEKQFYLRLSIL